MAPVRWALLIAGLLLATDAHAGEIVLVETGFDALESSVIVRDLASGKERRVAALPHVPGWGAAGSLSPDGKLLAASVLAEGNRPWRHARVYLVDLDGGAAPRRVLDEAVFAAPVWTPAGALLAVRSVGETEPSREDARQGRLMDLDLEIVAAGGSSGPHVLYRDRCNSLELVGAMAGGEIAVIRSAWEGNTLIALRQDGAVRRVAELGPTVAAWPHRTPDGAAVVFQQVDRRDGGLAIVRVGMDGTRRELARLAHLFASPVPLAQGVAFTSADGRSIELVDASGRVTRTLWRDPGAERVVSARASDDGRSLVIEASASGPARTFVLEVESGRSATVKGPPDHWREAMGLRRLP